MPVIGGVPIHPYTIGRAPHPIGSRIYTQIDTYANKGYVRPNHICLVMNVVLQFSTKLMPHLVNMDWYIVIHVQIIGL